MESHRVRVQPVTQRSRSADLACDVKRTYGYRCVCSCGYVGKTWREIGVARAEGRVHDYRPPGIGPAGGV